MNELEKIEKYEKRMSVLFDCHEKFMLDLCKILHLDYVTADEHEILEAVRALKNHTLPEFSGGLAIEQDVE